MKFLLVDDDLDDVDLFQEAISKCDSRIDCTIAENGEEVFDLLPADGSYKPDVIFLDINMPVMNGWECLEMLKKHPSHRNIPVIIYSTSTAKQDVQKAYSLGATAFLAKPEDFRELTKILCTVAETPQHFLQDRLRAFGSVRRKLE